MIDLFRTISPKLIRLYMVSAVPVALIVAYLFGTLRGALVFAVSLYAYIYFFGDFKPHTTAQLIFWFSDLANEMKSSIVTGLITVLGFFIAFQSATSGWKEQARITLQISIADDIERFYNEALMLISDMQIYAESVVKEISRINSSGMQPEDSSILEIYIKETVIFKKNRERLSAMSIDVYRLSSKHSSLLMPISGALKALDDCSDALSRVTEVMWINIPDVQLNEKNPRRFFVSKIDLESWSNFVDICESEDELIIGLIGVLRGVLFAPLAKLTFAMITNVVSRSDDLEHAIKKIQKKTR